MFSDAAADVVISQISEIDFMNGTYILFDENFKNKTKNRELSKYPDLDN